MSKKNLKRGKDIKKILNLAKNVLTTTGWCQNDYMRKGDKVVHVSAQADRFCVMGAVGFSSRKLGLGELGYAAAKRQLDSTAQSKGNQYIGFENAIEYNDADGRTKSQVLQLIDETVARIA